MKSTEMFIKIDSDYYDYEPSMIAKNSFFYPLCLGHFFYEAGYQQYRNSYDSFLLLYVIDGTFTFEIEGKVFQASPNQVVLLDCYEAHGYSLKENAECLWCHFDGVLARNYYRMIVERDGNCIDLSTNDSFISDFLKVYDVFDKAMPIREAYISNIINGMLTTLLLLDNNVNEVSPSIYIEKTLSYINLHFAEEITVEALAKNVSLSPYYFIRRFKKETGFTPHEYLLNKRLSVAKYLLKSTDESIKNICFSTGFSSESVFCTAFKQKNGITPAKFRAE